MARLSEQSDFQIALIEAQRGEPERLATIIRAKAFLSAHDRELLARLIEVTKGRRRKVKGIPTPAAAAASWVRIELAKLGAENPWRARDTKRLIKQAAEDYVIPIAKVANALKRGSPK